MSLYSILSSKILNLAYLKPQNLILTLILLIVAYANIIFFLNFTSQELAKILQQEEDARAQQMYARRQYQQQQQQQQRGQHPHPHQRPHPQYDSNDPRYAHYAQQEQFAQQQFYSQDQNRYPNPNQSQGSYGPGVGTHNMSQNPGNMGNIPRPAHAQKIKRKTSCVIM